MKVLVAGAGAIGQWLAARLPAHEVTILARPDHVAAAEDLHITGRTRFEGALQAVTDVADLDGRRFDAVFVTTKAHQTATMAATVAPLVAHDGVLASLQNGLGNGAKAAAAVGADRVAVCLTSHGVSMNRPGHLEHAGEGPTKVGAMPGADPTAARRAHALLEDAGLAPQWVDDVVGHVWQKAIVNAGINPVAAAAGVRNGDLLAGRLWDDAAKLVEEAVALSRAAGVPLPPDDCIQAMRSTLERTAMNRCSMLQDVQAGRRTEIEQITGRFVRLARRLGYPMFASEAAYRAIKAFEEKALGDEAALAATRDEVEWEGRHEGAPF